MKKEKKVTQAEIAQKEEPKHKPEKQSGEIQRDWRLPWEPAWRPGLKVKWE